MEAVDCAQAIGVGDDDDSPWEVYRKPMRDENLVVVGILVGLAAMIVVLVRYQRGKERRLAAQDEIEIPIMSFWWSVATVVLSIVIGPLALGGLSALSPSWFRAHAAVATLSMLAASGLLVPLCLWLTHGWRRIGALRYTATRLTLEMKDQRYALDLDRSFELYEGSSTGPGGSPLQVLSFRQDGVAWGFSYGLPITRKPYVNLDVDGYLTPLLGGEVRVIHDRIRARLAPPTARVRDFNR
jgi:uncharacterized membrane protein